jgi:hypothetical protein
VDFDRWRRRSARKNPTEARRRKGFAECEGGRTVGKEYGVRNRKSR